ncbi:MAG: mevalonate kinase [Chloroflexota bacterium]
MHKQTTATAPGKVILIGEHAVVYNRPAIAVPVLGLEAKAVITDMDRGTGCILSAPQIQLYTPLADADTTEPLALVTRLTLEKLGITAIPDWRIEVTSELPVASGMGSGAAVSAALVRAIYTHVGRNVDDAVDAETISALVYESERLHHGTPSGIDNTVIAYAKPVWFMRGQPPEVFTPSQTLTIVIADSGTPSPTKETVGDVRRWWQASPQQYEGLFDEIGAIAQEARGLIEGRNPSTSQQDMVEQLGVLFRQNQIILEQIGVSSPLLEQLITAACDAGALGAKLSGGGRGGNIVALVRSEQIGDVRNALLMAGAKRVVVTTVK